MAALVKQSLVDQIYMQLRDEIINQEITWGEKLNVNELQERFGISSTPIREALNRLQKEGLVEYKNNVGVNVIEIGEQDIIEIQEVTMTLDCAAIKHAMGTGKLEDIAKELLEQIENYERAKDDKERSNYIEAFSDIFYKYAANSRLIAISHLVRGQQRMLRSTYRKEKKGASSMEEHRAMHRAVLAGDVNAVLESMEKNYKKGTEILLKVICNKS